MADFAVHVDLSAWRAARRNIDSASQRAAMWAVRESGRRTKRFARQQAPVSTSTRKTVKVNGKTLDFKPGLLRKSIASSKRLRRVGGGYALKVGPRGGYVHLYAGKIEQRNGYMSGALAQVRPQVGQIHEQAMARALRRYSR